MTDNTYSEEWRARCEARDWLRRVREKSPISFAHGQQMLDAILTDIAKKRGQPAADALKNMIYEERQKPQ